MMENLDPAYLNFVEKFHRTMAKAHGELADEMQQELVKRAMAKGEKECGNCESYLSPKNALTGNFGMCSLHQLLMHGRSNCAYFRLRAP